MSGVLIQDAGNNLGDSFTPLSPITECIDTATDEDRADKFIVNSLGVTSFLRKAGGRNSLNDVVKNRGSFLFEE